MPKEWYVSFHGGEEKATLNNLHVYSTDGKELRKALNKKSLAEGVKLRELRGFAFGPDKNLYVVNAYFEYSEILKFTGTLNINGGASYPFTAQAAGLITATLTTLGADNTTTSSVGLSLGTWCVTHGPAAMMTVWATKRRWSAVTSSMPCGVGVNRTSFSTVRSRGIPSRKHPRATSAARKQSAT